MARRSSFSLLLGSLLNNSLHNYKDINTEMKISKICGNYIIRLDVERRV